ncbi:hypothetical protein Vafri_10867 [Volvox africanus]|uniref:Uncharacterized protein n=1 Tax=Volvox africanus TaxID=51714 RepID=A0A8J4B6V7_9CHLO|nr:hypothetical protein Vafri_10867 [Volvox africanus]
MFAISGRVLRPSLARLGEHRLAAHLSRSKRNARFVIREATTSQAPMEELVLVDGDINSEADAVLIREAEAQRQAFIMQDTCSFLASDLKMLFEKGEITESRYSPKIAFEDPISKFNSRDEYVFITRLLRTLFNMTFDLHSIAVTGSETVTASWTMEMVFWLVPWRPNITITGRTVYKVDPRTGIVLSHTDYWDALQRNA